jgi:hypothetical protein
MNLESRLAKLEARQPARRIVWREPGVPVERPDEAICIRWLDDAEADPPAVPAPVPPPAAPEPVVTPPPAEPPAKPALPERPRPTHPTYPTRPPSSTGWT